MDPKHEAEIQAAFATPVSDRKAKRIVLAKALGPYIGPRGGKWADPQHKIPWNASQQDRADAADHHSDMVGRTLNPHDFDVVETKVVSVDSLYDYDDIDAWAEFDEGELADEPKDEQHSELERFRGKAFADRVMEWHKNNSWPPVVVIETREGDITIGDGRGRITAAIALGVTKLPVTFIKERPASKTAKKPRLHKSAAYRAIMSKALGPYIGPKGGKWADPAHTIHWDEAKHIPLTAGVMVEIGGERHVVMGMKHGNVIAHKVVPNEAGDFGSKRLDRPREFVLDGFWGQAKHPQKMSAESLKLMGAYQRSPYKVGDSTQFFGPATVIANHKGGMVSVRHDATGAVYKRHHYAVAWYNMKGEKKEPGAVVPSYIPGKIVEAAPTKSTAPKPTSPTVSSGGSPDAAAKMMAAKLLPVGSTFSMDPFKGTMEITSLGEGGYGVTAKMTRGDGASTNVNLSASAALKLRLFLERDYPATSYGRFSRLRDLRKLGIGDYGGFTLEDDDLPAEDLAMLRGLALFTGANVATVRDPSLFQGTYANHVTAMGVGFIKLSGFTPTKADYEMANKILVELANHPNDKHTPKVVYRGMGLPGNLVDGLSAGSTFDIWPISSFGASESTAVTFSGHGGASSRRTVWVFEDVNNGTHINGFSKFPHEDEILSGGKCRVTKTKMVGNIHYFYAEYITEKSLDASQHAELQAAITDVLKNDEGWPALFAAGLTDIPPRDPSGRLVKSQRRIVVCRS